MTTGPDDYDGLRSSPVAPAYPPVYPPVYPPAYPPVYPPVDAPGPTASAPTDRFAVPALVVGIVSLVLVAAYGIGVLGSPVALVLGRRSMRRIDNSGGRLGGRGMALAGFVLGIIGTILLGFVLLGVVVAVAVPVYLNATR